MSNHQDKKRTLGNGILRESVPEFDVNAGRSNIQIIAIEHGAVQFSARRMLALSDDVVTVPFSVMFHICGQLLNILASDTEHGAALRAHIGGRAPMLAPPARRPAHEQ